MLRTAQGGVEGEGAGVGEAVHPFARRQPGHRPAVVLLVQKEAGFLAVFKVYGVPDPVFRDLGHGPGGHGLAGEGGEALVLGQTLLVPQSFIVALVNTADILPVLPQRSDEKGEEGVIALLQPKREGLDHQNVVESVHCQSGQAVGLSKDHPAGGEVGRLQHALPIGPGVLEPAEPEAVVKGVVGVPGQKPHPDEGGKAQKPRPQPGALFAAYVHNGTVFHGFRAGKDLPGVDPGVTFLNGPLTLFGDGDDGIRTGMFHGMTSFLDALTLVDRRG